MEWPSKKQSSSNTKMLMEHQFLPLAAAAAAASSSSSSSFSMKSWSEDPSRVQKLMMGSIACTSSRSKHTTTPVEELDNNHKNIPLPLGWERCLDLKSGELFIIKKKPESNIAPMSTSSKLSAEEAINSSKKSHARAKAIVGKLAGIEDGESASPPMSMCLDLDLKLTNDQQIHPTSKPSTGDQSSKLSKLSSTSTSTSNPKQNWKWKPRHPTATPENPNYSSSSSTYEEVSLLRESTMATAVCPKCLMYVLLRKSSPACPKCCSPVLLHQPKRPRLEITPADGLSLSTR